MPPEELLALLSAVQRSHARLAWLYWLLVEAARPPLEEKDEDAPGWAKPIMHDQKKEGA
jgi:hypothetical protein